MKSLLQPVLKAKNLPNGSIFIKTQLTLCTTGGYLNLGLKADAPIGYKAQVKYTK